VEVNLQIVFRLIKEANNISLDFLIFSTPFSKRVNPIMSYQDLLIELCGCIATATHQLKENTYS
jgi:hypothetical protein